MDASFGEETEQTRALKDLELGLTGGKDLATEDDDWKIVQDSRSTETWPV